MTILDRLKTGPLRLLVVGGGPAGLEIAANTWKLIHAQGNESHLILLGGKKFLANFPDKARRLAQKSLEARRIEVRPGAHLRALASGSAGLDNGQEIPFDIAFLALGVKPSPIFAASGMPTGPDGGLLVNQYLHALDHPNVFGGGDCISFQDRPLAKVGVYAVRQNPILFHNLLASLEGQDLIPFHPQDAYLLIFNLGNGKGIFCKKSWVWDGRLAWALKNYIDRNFMKKFQISGEPQET